MSTLLAALVFASAAIADHGVIDRISGGSLGGNGDFDASFAGISADGNHIFFNTGEALVNADNDPPNGAPDACLDPADLVSTVACSDIYDYNNLTGGTALISNGLNQPPRYDASGCLSSTSSSGAERCGFNAASPDGRRVFFTTRQRLVPEDLDPENGCADLVLGPALCSDVYMRENGKTTLISTGPIGGDGAFEAWLGCSDNSGCRSPGISADGTRVFFVTEEPLTIDDVDSEEDVYMRDVTAPATDPPVRISAGPRGGNRNQHADAEFNGVSQNGNRVFFSTDEPLGTGDTDTFKDIYERRWRTRTTVLLSGGTPAVGGNGPQDASYEAASADGNNVFFTTREKLVAEDTDPPGGCESRSAPADCRDVYKHSGTTTALVSTGSTGGNGAFDASFDAISQDGTRAFFTTREKLTAVDTDPTGGCTSGSVAVDCRDVYERSAGVTTLVSDGHVGAHGPYDASFDGISQDGTKVFFNTPEPLVGDSDTGCDDGSGNLGPCTDIYQYTSGSTTLVSTGGNGAFEAAFEGASQDGSRVFFSTRERLTSTDQDPRNGCSSGGSQVDCRDVYERFNFRTTLISTGPLGGNGAHNASFAGTSLDGAQVFFTTREPLVDADRDAAEDLYRARPGADLSLTMSDSPDPAVTGETVTYTLTVKNNGPQGASGVTVTDNLPAGMSFQSATPSQGSCTQNTGTVTCPLGDLASGDSATVEVKVTPQGSGVFTNSADVVASQADPSAGNNSAAQSTTVNSPTPPPPPPPAPPAAGGGAPAVVATASPVPTGVAKDSTPPTLAVSSRTKEKLDRILSKGLRVTVRCLEACTVRVELEADRKTAKRLRLGNKAVVVGRASAKLAANESERVTVKLTRKAKKRLGRKSRSRAGRRIKLKLQTAASDAAGNARTVNGKVTLER